MFNTKQFTLKHIHSFKISIFQSINCCCFYKLTLLLISILWSCWQNYEQYIHLKRYLRIYNIGYVYQYLNSLRCPCCITFTWLTQLAQLQDHPVVKLWAVLISDPCGHLITSNTHTIFINININISNDISLFSHNWYCTVLQKCG